MTVALAPDWNIAPLNGLSQVKGRTDATLSEAPIHRFLLDTVQRFADRPAVVFREQGVRWTWAQFQAEVDALAAGFIALGLRVGDKLRLDAGQGQESVVSVAGIFQLGVRELDTRYVYLGMQQAQSLLNLPGAATSLDLKLHHIFEAQTMATHISRLTGLQAQSWIETNTQLMNALQSQRLSTQMISSFVALSVALGIASVLAVSVVQRTREIGILRAMGASRQQMLRVFLLQGAMFGLVGSLLGSLASYGLVAIFNNFSAQLFYIPLDPWLAVLAAGLATATGIVAAAIPARRAATLDPVQAIRHV